MDADLMRRLASALVAAADVLSDERGELVLS